MSHGIAQQIPKNIFTLTSIDFKFDKGLIRTDFAWSSLEYSVETYFLNVFVTNNSTLRITI